MAIDLDKAIAFAEKWNKFFDEKTPQEAYYQSDQLQFDALDAGLEMDRFRSFMDKYRPDLKNLPSWDEFYEALYEVEKVKDAQTMGNMIFTQWRTDQKSEGYPMPHYPEWYLEALPRLIALCNEEKRNGQNRGKP